MLIGHGASDVRCTLAQSDLIVTAMQEKGIAFRAMVEAFLARHLGGRAEPIGGDFQGSSHEIRAGADILGEVG
jgi:acylaminoacyl-peptidase